MCDWADCEAEIALLTERGDHVKGAQPGQLLSMQLKCRTCERLLPRESFYLRSETARGRYLDCKQCWLRSRARRPLARKGRGL